MCKKMKDPPVAKSQWVFSGLSPILPPIVFFFFFFFLLLTNKYFASFLKRTFFICLTLGLTEHVSKLTEAQFMFVYWGPPSGGAV